MAKIIRKNRIYLPIILFILLSLYGYYDVTTSSQGGIADGDRTVVHIMVPLLIAIEGIYLLFKRVRNREITYITTPLYFYGAWLVISSLINGIPLSTIFFYLLFIIWWILTAKFFSSYTIRNNTHQKLIIRIFVLLFLVWIIFNIKARIQINLSNDKYGITMFIYYVLLLFPFVMLIKNIALRNIFIGIGVVTTIFSLKRGAIISLPAMLIVFFLIRTKINGKALGALGGLILISVLIYVLVAYVDQQTEGLLFSRFDSESLQSGSGRDELRAAALDNISNRDIIRLIIGLGAGSTVKFLETGAHNEWIEALFSFGIIGICIYFWMVVGCCRLVINNYKAQNPVTPYLAMYVVYLLFCTIFSGFIFMHVAFYFWSGIGVFIGMRDTHSRLL